MSYTGQVRFLGRKDFSPKSVRVSKEGLAFLWIKTSANRQQSLVFFRLQQHCSHIVPVIQAGDISTDRFKAQCFCYPL